MSNSPGEVDLSWTDNSGLETRFEIAQSNSLAVVLSVGANVTMASRTGLDPGTSYPFYVRACGIQSVGANSITEAKCSAWTGPVAKTPDGSG